MTLRGVRDALWRTVEGVPRKHTLQMAAAMAYYEILKDRYKVQIEVPKPKDPVPGQ